MNLYEFHHPAVARRSSIGLVPVGPNSYNEGEVILINRFCVLAGAFRSVIQVHLTYPYSITAIEVPHMCDSARI